VSDTTIRRNMGLIQKFKDIFMKPDVSDQERIDRWKTEVDKADRLKTLHRQSRKQEKRGLTVEDFERAKQTKKQKNKTLSSNF
jgi:hypothetical protein